MDWLRGTTDWCWLGPSCSINWTAWAAVGTILAAVATFTAVIVALRASQREHERTLQLRDDEWARQDRVRRERTIVLAHTFSRELHHAGMPLMYTYNELLTAMREPGLDGILRATEIIMMSVPADRHLQMMKRSADRLEGFSSRQAVGILNAIATWETVTGAAPQGLRDCPLPMQVDQVGRRMVAIEQALEMFRDLQELLNPVAAESGFLQEVSTEELFEEQRERLDHLAKQFAIFRESDAASSG